MIPDDGEGATHLITIDVEGCRDRDEARDDRPGRRRQPAREDRHPRRRPQLGPDRLGRRLRGRPVRGGRAVALAQRRRRSTATATPLALRRRRRSPRTCGPTASRTSACVLTRGDASIRFWTCDLTAEYVRLNADYTT